MGVDYWGHTGPGASAIDDMNLTMHTTSPVTLVVYIVDTTYAQRCDSLREHIRTSEKDGATAYYHALAKNELSEAVLRSPSDIYDTFVDAVRLGHRMPKGARVVGLLDDAGYHGEAGAPVPSAARLEEFAESRGMLIGTDVVNRHLLVSAAPNEAFAGRTALA